VEKAWTGDITRLLAAEPGSAYRRTDKSGAYWYWQPPTGPEGLRPAARFIGRDVAEVRARLDAIAGGKAPSLRERHDPVRALRAARLPTPHRITGEVLAAMAEAGVFRVRAAVVGSVAFQSYAGLLGVRIPASLARTSDRDEAQFHSIAVAVFTRR
jgi:hypothetical protein